MTADYRVSARRCSQIRLLNGLYPHTYIQRITFHPFRSALKIKGNIPMRSVHDFVTVAARAQADQKQMCQNTTCAALAGIEIAVGSPCQFIHAVVVTS